MKNNKKNSNQSRTSAGQSTVAGYVDENSNFIRGSVELMILYLLTQKDFYGYELTQLMDSLSDGVISIPIGSLYPTLYKLIDKGYVTTYKKLVGKRLTRVYYHIEATGIARLNIITDDYYATHNAIQSILKYTI